MSLTSTAPTRSRAPPASTPPPGRSSAASWSSCPPTPSTASRADAFTPAAVDRLLAAKGRGRDMPVPVLVGEPARRSTGWRPGVPPAARDLVEAFWPGGADAGARARAVAGLGPGRRPTARSPCGCRCTRSPSTLLRRDRPDGGLQRQPHRPRRRPTTAAGGRRAARRRACRVYLDGGPRAGSAVQHDRRPAPATVPRVLRARRARRSTAPVVRRTVVPEVRRCTVESGRREPPASRRHGASGADRRRPGVRPR